MSGDRLTLLLVEDSPADARLVREMLGEGTAVARASSTFELEHVDSLSAARACLEHRAIDAVLLDLFLPDSEGLGTFTTLHAHASHTPILILSGLDSEALAIQAVRAGAQDYLVKGQLDSNTLVRAVRYAIERKRSAEALRQAESRLEQILQTMVDGMVVVDLDGQITYANQAAERILEVRRDDVIGRYYSDREWRQVDSQGNAYPGEQLPLAVALRERREVRELEHGIVAPDGERKWLSVNAAPLLDEEGRLCGAIANFRDVTERKRAEEARIAQLERELRALELLSHQPQTNVTARIFGLLPLGEGWPDVFEQLVLRYEELMNLALEERAYKVEHHVSDELRAMADRLGFLRAGPRDVVELHAAALKRASRGASHQKAQAYVDEGRLMVLELMGYLTSFYRNHAPGAGQSSAAAQSESE